MYNHLQHETSPYLLQHARNPVDWYPWCDAAFERAKAEDKPIFLSIGYSTCHWCHVMAHESFEDTEIAAILNRYFISIKVDKEERPDIDSIYMSVCQALTGSGGWPTSIFMTAEQKPFLAGTYFPKDSRGGMIGFRQLLLLIHEKWESDRSVLLAQADQVVAQLKQYDAAGDVSDSTLISDAVALYKRSYDRKYGGFGSAPKFPMPHNLLFLLTCYERYGDEECLEMAEHTLLQMYRGGLFDHIGFGFCRYSTDKYFLAPHFEKMLYDNALLILAYCKAYAVTKKPLYLEIAEKTAAYILRDMTAPEGCFYSAQDADSDGEEGKFYLFTPDEILGLLGQDRGEIFNRRFDISSSGNFEGKNIPNLLHSDTFDRSCDAFLEQVRAYRAQRCSLHLDDKILTSRNALMIAAMCWLYRLSGNKRYLDAARRSDSFIQAHLCENDTLFVSFRAGQRGVKGFLDDYAAYLFAQLALYGATLEHAYLDRAEHLCEKVQSTFHDARGGGFYLYGAENEQLILRPKETYDGAIPSGNSLMAWNLVQLSRLLPDHGYESAAERQLDYLASDAAQYPTGYAMFLLALLNHETPPPKVTVVPAAQSDTDDLPLLVSPDTSILLLDEPTAEYPLKGGKTTFYVCRGHSCLPPVNDLKELL